MLPTLAMIFLMGKLGSYGEWNVTSTEHPTGTGRDRLRGRRIAHRGGFGKGRGRRSPHAPLAAE